MRRFFAPPECISNTRIILEEDETRHLRDVLRLRPGDSANVFDGAGSEYACKIESIGKKTAELTVTTAVEPLARESPLDLTMAAAVLKGDKFDLVVQKLVELGTNTLIPLITVRTEADLRGVNKRLTRWRRIALEATKQCGRARLIQILQAHSVEEVFGQFSSGAVLFTERGGNGFSDIKPTGTVTALIGPEGGWDDAELEKARGFDVPMVTFGGRILRAETAAIAVATVLQHRFGDLN
jgi:16S rRNA (uracil1498-N3)-methyltransferase